MINNEIYILPIELSDTLNSQIEWLRMAKGDNIKEAFPPTLLSSVYHELIESITVQRYSMIDLLAYYDSLSGDYFVIKDKYTGECYWRCPESVSASLRGLLNHSDK